jgi:hypothetical protein
MPVMRVMRVVHFASCVAVCLALTATFATAAPGEGKKGPPDPEKAFARKDADKNGTLTLDEFKAGMKEPRVAKAPEQFKKLDANGDGKVTLNEFKSGVKQKS